MNGASALDVSMIIFAGLFGACPSSKRDDLILCIRKYFLCFGSIMSNCLIFQSINTIMKEEICYCRDLKGGENIWHQTADSLASSSVSSWDKCSQKLKALQKASIPLFEED